MNTDSLDKFADCSDIQHIFNADYFICYDGKELSHKKYTSLGKTEHQDFILLSGKYKLNAFANRFFTELTTHKDSDIKTEQGYIFDGMLWVIPNEVGKDNYGFGGRILLYSQEDSLKKIVRGEKYSTMHEIDERIDSLKEGYLQQKREIIKHARENRRDAAVARLLPRFRD